MSDESRPRSPRAGVALAALLAVAVVVGAVLVWVPGRGSEGVVVPRGPPRFGAGTEPRLEALRDRLVRGLLSLVEPDGGWPGRARLEKDLWARRESTALAFAGLTAAARMGSRVEGLESAIAGARRLLLAPPRVTVGVPGAGAPSR